jgi:hypothetical protein
VVLLPRSAGPLQQALLLLLLLLLLQPWHAHCGSVGS